MAKANKSESTTEQENSRRSGGSICKNKTNEITFNKVKPTGKWLNKEKKKKGRK